MLFLFSSNVSPDVSKVSEGDLGVNYWQFHIHRKERRKRVGSVRGRTRGREGGSKERIDLMYPSFGKASFQRSLVDFPSGPRARVRSHDYA